MTPKKFLPFPWWKRLLWRIKIAAGYLIGRGVWIWDMRDGQLWWNRANCAVYGMDMPQGLIHDYKSFEGMLWDDMDRNAVKRDVEIAREVQSLFYSAFRAVDQCEGTAIIVQARGWFFYDENGKPLVMMGWNKRLPYTQQKENQIVVRQVALEKLKQHSYRNSSMLLTAFFNHYAHR